MLAQIKNDDTLINAKIYDFPDRKLKGKAPNIQTIDRRVDPIKSEEDLRTVIKYLHNKIDMAKRTDTKLSASRNYLLFITGITMGLRVSDLVVLTWDDIFEDDMKTFRTSLHNVREKKTKKLKRLVPTEPVKVAVTEYLNITGFCPKRGNYIFISGRKNNSGSYSRITRAAVEKMFKDIEENCCKKNFNTHTLRKTCAYQYYMSMVNSADPFEQMLALEETQHFLNHSSPMQTLTYLGIASDREKERMDSVGKQYLSFMTQEKTEE